MKKVHAIEKGCSHFGKRGVSTFIKITLPSCYWGFTLLRKRFTFWKGGFTLMKIAKKNIITSSIRLTFEKRFHI